jgi:hypothetical protein
MNKERRSLRSSCAILSGGSFNINNEIYNKNYLYLSTNNKSDFALLRNISNCDSERMNLALTLNKPESKFHIQCDKKFVLNIQKDKVGINTTTPLTNLDVVGSGCFSENLLIKEDLNVQGKITGFNVDSDDEKSAINLQFLNTYLSTHYYNMQGPAGPQGIQGPVGQQGPQGQPGRSIKGEQGEQGITGEQGIKGEQGITGEQGIKGEQGEQGLKGDKGDKGDKGLKGDKGEPGQAILDGIINVGSSLLDKFILNSTTLINGPLLNSYILINTDKILTDIEKPLYIVDNSNMFNIDLKSSKDGTIVKFLNLFIDGNINNVNLFSSDSVIYNLNRKKVILPTQDTYDTNIFTIDNPLNLNSFVTLIYLELTNPGWYIIEQSPVLVSITR